MTHSQRITAEDRRPRPGLLCSTLQVLAAVALSFALAAPGYAASIALQGSIPTACTISVTGQGNTTLDLSTNQTDLDVADVTEDCNNADGFTITVQTTNGTTGGLLVSQDNNGTNNTDQAYSVKYDGNSVTFSAGSGEGANRSAAVVSNTVDLQISTTIPAGGLPADTYTDTLTLTITAN